MFSEKEDIRTYHNLTGSEQFLEEEQEAKVKFFYVVLWGTLTQMLSKMWQNFGFLSITKDIVLYCIGVYLRVSI